jgi:Curli assembly protein CsgE
MNPLFHHFQTRRHSGMRACCAPIALLLALASVSVCAQPSRPSQTPPLTDGVKGLVINQTVSGRGYEFYRVFSELWMLKPDSDNYSLSVVERPQRYGNNFILIFLGQTRIYGGIVPRRFDQIRPLCEQAVDSALANIIANALEGGDAAQFDVGQSEL